MSTMVFELKLRSPVRRIEEVRALWIVVMIIWAGM
jgi:hypothetical protein